MVETTDQKPTVATNASLSPELRQAIRDAIWQVLEEIVAILQDVRRARKEKPTS